MPSNPERYADGADLTPPPTGPGQITQTFDNSTILITGGTGFLGQILVNKLLYTCLKIKKIYLLIRPKKGKSSEDRLEEMFANMIFDKMKQNVRNYREKVFAISGDCSLSNLGLTEVDRCTLIRETNYIFHCAATKNFNENLRLAVQINVRAVRDLINMASKMQELKAFLHLSTLYANYPNKEIDEKFYNVPMHYEKLISLVSVLDDNNLKLITPSLLGKWPNVYFFTKALAENVIRDSNEEVPITVVRPSIAVATLLEPVAGWINNSDGPTGILCGIEMGLLHTLYTNSDTPVDIIPADYVVNLIIAAVWDIAYTRKVTENHEVLTKTPPIPIYNFLPSSGNPLTSAQFLENAKNASSEIPSMKQLWKRFCRITSKKYVLLFYLFAFHYMPAFLIDSTLFITGRTPKLISAYNRIHKSVKSMEFMHNKQWLIRDTKTKKLFDKMCDVDRLNFNFDLNDMRWDVYFLIYMRGIRVYLLKDPLDTIPKAQERNLFFKIAHYLLCLSLVTSSYKLFSFFLSDKFVNFYD